MKNLSFQRMGCLFLIIAGIFSSSCRTESPDLTITRNELENKIKGGWAGQVIGCTFGGPTEFQWNGTMIQDYLRIPWDNTRCTWYYDNFPALYDDIYMDLTFVNVFENEGLDAPASAHALAFANADYLLAHANQAARVNILNGIMPPESGHWTKNAHSEDIDFQIEADFAGLMSPGMVNQSAEICDKIGHIMNFGDGWYGGVYVAAMYSLAFISDDIEYIVTEALKTIPGQSQFYRCMDDVIAWWRQYPDDWKQTWFECQKKWSSDIGCPMCVYQIHNIDAKINAAYILIGLLYGEGDFSRTMEITTRCGYDSDCNPASAGGILGTMLGYEGIPEYWLDPLKPVEDRHFSYTTLSLNDVYELGAKHAIEILERNGAIISEDNIEIPYEEIEPVKLEIGFEGHFPQGLTRINSRLDHKNSELEFEFEGNGFALNGRAGKTGPQTSFADFIHGRVPPGSLPDRDIKLELYIDGELADAYSLSTSIRTRREEVAYIYQLPESKHKVILKLVDPDEDYFIQATGLVTYGSTEVRDTWHTHD